MTVQLAPVTGSQQQKLMQSKYQSLYGEEMQHTHIYICIERKNGEINCIIANDEYTVSNVYSESETTANVMSR